MVGNNSESLFLQDSNGKIVLQPDNRCGFTMGDPHELKHRVRRDTGQSKWTIYILVL